MPFLAPVLSTLWSFATSQVGVLMIATLLSYGYGHHRASVVCKEREAAAHARAMQAHIEEMARQAKAAEAIAVADKSRAEDASKAAVEMQGEVEALKKGKGDAKAGCVIDSEYAGRVRKLDRHGRH